MNTQILTQTCTKVKGVFTKRLMKTLSVPITSVALLIGFVGSSSANEFTASMTSGDETYYSDSGYITHTAEVETSHVFAEVDWYVNDVWQTTSKGDGAKKTASFTKGFSGNGYGRSYEIEAVAYSEDGRSASDSHRIRVKKNVVRYDGGSENDLGYAEIEIGGWSGTTASVEQSGSVNNYTDGSVNVTYRFVFKVLHVVKHKQENGVWIWKVKAEDGNLYVPPECVGQVTVTGTSHSCYHQDSYTLPEMIATKEAAWWDNGDRARMEAETSVDVDGSTWHARVIRDYRFPHIE